ncbi:nuclear transport factor 2 family protein [Paracnuella aquatica]|uniref:nuclear transport factor 2 family protein n=1 Tax=Paracnuella aquatica TaxID=2268757 RepID=UPI000DEFAC5B|nr:nuclear transport factor 2 family protein [Paracnuella aquatica]RPD44451.1 nuclear transport factor 2 family protein [Paracnuella aquatica]
MTHRETIIQNYIDGYNIFSVDQMVAHFAEGIQFENIQDGKITLSLTGIDAFKEQAERAKNFFTNRRQTITSFKHSEAETRIAVDYTAVLAMDFPNGLKKDQQLNLTGTSVFEFAGDRIVKLTDVS